MKRPGSSVTFDDYASKVFLPYVLSWFEKHERVDVVWDVYQKDSLKAETRRERGAGIRRRVTATTKIPGNWASFFRVDENKEELFMFLAEKMRTANVPQDKLLITTLKDSAISNPPRDLTDIAPCDHEEADTRVFLHVYAASLDGHSKVTIRANDSDIVVIAVSQFHKMRQLQELWIIFGTGNNVKYIPVHYITELMGDKALGLLAFHSITGCDTTSSFFGKGKKTAWKVWEEHPELTSTFKTLSKPNVKVSDVKRAMSSIQNFVVHLYGVHDEDILTCDSARAFLFDKGQPFENLPPTADVLLLHLLRASFQASTLRFNFFKSINNAIFIHQM